jgi:hypothetical protein
MHISLARIAVAVQRASLDTAAAARSGIKKQETLNWTKTEDSSGEWQP